MLGPARLLFWWPSSPYWGHGTQRHDPALCDHQRCGTLPPLTFHTQTWRIGIPLLLPHIRPSSPPSPPPHLPIFSWLLCVKWSTSGRQKLRCILYYYYFCRSIRRPKQLDGVSLRAPPPTHLRYNIPPTASANFGLIVGCLDWLAAT